jgi:signal peptidase
MRQSQCHTKLVQDQQEEFLTAGCMDALAGPPELLKNELAAEVVRRFGTLRLRVTGSSMLPAIRPNDILLVRRCRLQDADPGDVILFMRQRRLFAHRVIGLSGGAVLVTQGDSIAQPDPCVTPGELLGKVIQVTRHDKSVPQQSKLTLPTRLAAALFRRSTMAARAFARLQGLRVRA